MCIRDSDTCPTATECAADKRVKIMTAGMIMHMMQNGKPAKVEGEGVR